MFNTSAWRGMLYTPPEGKQPTMEVIDSTQRFYHFRLTADSMGRLFIPVPGMVLIMMVLLLTVAAHADQLNEVKDNPSGPVSCVELATDPANELVGHPLVKSVKSKITGNRRLTHCQVDILYGSNPDQNIKIRVGLPLNSLDGGSGGVEGAWNGRTKGIGGGGCTGSLIVTEPVRDGYVGSGTDTGHTGGNCAPGVNWNGTYNDQFINDFIRNSLKAQVLFMKSVASSYYGMKPLYNYWYGCSTGGRQGYVLAQELGSELDGILANSPAIYWTRFQTAQMWGQIVMKDLVGGPIDAAKLNQATASAIKSCDANDGVVDGVIDDPRTCTFSATENFCGESNTPASNCLTWKEAQAIDMIWDGPHNGNGKKIWFGLDRGTTLGGFFSLNSRYPFPLGVTQFQWDEHDRRFDWHTVSIEDYEVVAQDGSRNIADTTDTFGNLDTLRNSGGKMITMVGANDPLIMPRGVINYYRQMASRYDNLSDSEPSNAINFEPVQQFYRLFRAPGVEHCGGGVGPQPRGLFEALVDWVEKGIAPDQIIATTWATWGETRNRPLCPYPQTAIYKGSGDPNDIDSFYCGGNLESASTVCKDVLVKYKNEINGPLDYRGTGVNQFICRDIDSGQGRKELRQ